MKRAWQRDLDREDALVRNTARVSDLGGGSQHTYGLETCPPDAPPRCPHCKAESIYTTQRGDLKLECRNCGRCWDDGELVRDSIPRRSLR